MPDQGFIIMLIILVIAIMFFCIIIYRDSHRFVTVFYRVRSAKLRQKCRIVMLSDLHNKEYGTDNIRLLQAIRAQKPDIILTAGDMLTRMRKRPNIVFR